jgi:hypothetical protein
MGDHCEIDVDECKMLPCANGGRCVDLVNNFKCVCAPGFAGPYCLQDVNECEPNPCANGARCVDKVNEFECVCAFGFAGNLCDQRANHSTSTVAAHRSAPMPSNRLMATMRGSHYGSRHSGYAARPVHHKQTSVDSDDEYDEQNQRLWLVVSVAAIVPLAALAVFLGLRWRALKHEQNVYGCTSGRSHNNGLPCKSIDEVDAIRQNEVNNTLLNNSGGESTVKSGNACSKLSPSANIIVNSLHRDGSLYSVNKAARLSAAVNQVGLPASNQKVKNVGANSTGTLPLPGMSPQPIYGGSVAYGSVAYGHVRSHPMYASVRPQSMYGSVPAGSTVPCSSNVEQRAALAAAAADYAASLYGINKSAKY